MIKNLGELVALENQFKDLAEIFTALVKDHAELKTENERLSALVEKYNEGELKSMATYVRMKGEINSLKEQLGTADQVANESAMGEDA